MTRKLPRREPVLDADPCVNRHKMADSSVLAFIGTPDGARRAVRARIAAFVRERGARGAICEEIENALGIPHQTCSARVSDLCRAGELHHTGERRNTSRSRPSRVLFHGPGPHGRPAASADRPPGAPSAEGGAKRLSDGSVAELL